MMRNYTLPLEILLHIISQVDEKETLSALCLTSKSLSSEALRHLYGHIDGRDDGRLHLLLIGTLICEPSLALLVRSYSITTTSDVGYSNVPELSGLQKEEDEETELELEDWDDSWDAVANSFSSQKYEYIWKLLPEALALMSNLEHLSFTDLAHDPCATHFLRRWKRYGYTFKLKTLEWRCAPERLEDVIDFLKGQEELEVLWIQLSTLEEPQSGPLSTAIDGPSTHHCQRLVHLSGNLKTLLHFLPNRPSITHVQWIAFFDNIEEGVTSLNAEWRRITHLSFGSFNDHQRLLRPAAKGLFDSLLALEIQPLNNVCRPQPLDSAWN